LPLSADGPKGVAREALISVVHTDAQQAKVSTPKKTKSTTRALAPVAAPVAAPAVIANGTVTPVKGAVVQAASASPAFVGATVTPRVTTGAAVVAAASAAPTALPFTGAPVGLLLLVGGVVLGAGALLTLAGARRTV
jgi:hypothetical protein